MSYESKSSAVYGQQLKVQRLVVPFQIVGNATPANKTQTSDLTSAFFIKSEGKDDITGALAAGESVTFVDAASDVNGIINIMIKTGTAVEKVSRASFFIRSSDDPTGYGGQGVSFGDADGLTNQGSIVLTIRTGLDLSAPGTYKMCLDVDYVEQD